jgi:hypothetical protein
MADAPPESCLLFRAHTPSVFLKGGDWKGIGQGDWGSLGGFLEDGVRNATVLVFMSSPLTDALHEIKERLRYWQMAHTDIDTGDFGSVVGVKLKGF